MWKKSDMMIAWNPQGTNLRYVLAVLYLRGVCVQAIVCFREGASEWKNINDPATGRARVYPTIAVAKEAAEAHAKAHGWTGDVEGD